MADRMSTEDLELELKKRKQGNYLKGAKQQAAGVSALLIAAFGAYEAQANKEVARITAELAAEAKVDTAEQESKCLGRVEALEGQLKAYQVAYKEHLAVEESRYDQLRQASRHGLADIEQTQVAVEPLSLAGEVMDSGAMYMAAPPEPPAPRDKGDDYRQKVQQVLKARGIK